MFASAGTGAVAWIVSGGDHRLHAPVWSSRPLLVESGWSTRRAVVSMAGCNGRRGRVSGRDKRVHSPSWSTRPGLFESVGVPDGVVASAASGRDGRVGVPTDVVDSVECGQVIGAQGCSDRSRPNRPNRPRRRVHKVVSITHRRDVQGHGAPGRLASLVQAS